MADYDASWWSKIQTVLLFPLKRQATEACEQARQFLLEVSGQWFPADCALFADVCCSRRTALQNVPSMNTAKCLPPTFTLPPARSNTAAS